MLRALVISALSVGFLSACSMSANTAAAEQGVDQFHQMLDAGQYHDIYAGSSPMLTGTTTESALAAFLDSVHRTRGNVKSAKEVNWRFNYDVKGTFVTLEYKTTYANGDAQETFVYVIDGQNAKLAGYHIQ